MAILRKELLGAACEAALKAPGPLLMSSATLTECLIVANRKGALPGMKVLLDRLQLTFVDITPDLARAAADAHARWGKGFHEAELNYGDCFSYVVAKTHDCPLLYVGDDFARTDIASALA